MVEGLLRDHLRVSQAVLAATVFPNGVYKRIFRNGYGGAGRGSPNGERFRLGTRCGPATKIGYASIRGKRTRLRVSDHVAHWSASKHRTR